MSKFSALPDPHAEEVAKNISNLQRYLIAKCEKCVSAHYCTVVSGCESHRGVKLRGVHPTAESSSAVRITPRSQTAHRGVKLHTAELKSKSLRVSGWS